MAMRNTHCEQSVFHPRGGTINTSAFRRGFTLIEILAVVLIIGIASAIVVPQISSRSDLKVRAGARMLVADLIYAQNMAISTQRWHYVKFDASNERYSVLDSVPLSGGDVIIKHPINKSPFTTQLGSTGSSSVRDILIASATLNGTDPAYRPEFTLAFDSLGTPFVYCYDLNLRNELLNGTIVLQSGTQTLSVIVERYTGEIKVQ